MLTFTNVVKCQVSDIAEYRPNCSELVPAEFEKRALLAFHLSLPKHPWTDPCCHCSRASLSIIICSFFFGCVAHLSSLSSQRPEKDNTVRRMLTQQLCDCWCYIADVSLRHHRDDFECHGVFYTLTRTKGITGMPVVNALTLSYLFKECGAWFYWILKSITSKKKKIKLKVK